MLPDACLRLLCDLKFMKMVKTLRWSLGL